MTYQAPGPYPGPQQYPQYPGGGYAGIPQRTPTPQAVMQSHYAMLVGAAASVVGGLLALTEIGTIRTALRNDLPGDSPVTIDTLVRVTVIGVIAAALIEAGLWIWMAYKVKAGRHWARVLSSVFFGIGAVSALIGGVSGVHFQSSTTTNGTTHTVDTSSPVQTASGWITIAIGLVAIVLMWRGSNSSYFRPQRYGDYQQPQYGYPGPGAGQPMQSFPQQAPPADPWNQTPPS